MLKPPTPPPPSHPLTYKPPSYRPTNMKSVNNILAGKAKQKESLIQIFYETSATHFSSQLAIKVSFAVSLRLHTPFIEVFPAKL